MHFQWSIYIQFSEQYPFFDISVSNQCSMGYVEVKKSNNVDCVFEKWWKKFKISMISSLHMQKVQEYFAVVEFHLLNEYVSKKLMIDYWTINQREKDYIHVVSFFKWLSLSVTSISVQTADCYEKFIRFF